MYPWKRTTWDRDAWRPDARASVGGAVAAALLVVAGFAALFSVVAPPFKLAQPAPSAREVLVFAEPMAPRPMPHVHAARPALPVQLPELERMSPPALAPVMGPGSFGLQDYLDERAKGDAAALREQVTGTELRRDLGKAKEQQALPDNQSYQNVDGQKVVRSGGGCAEIHTVQGSSVPNNRVAIAVLTDCPGGPADPSEEMGKALQDWAKKARQAGSPPP